MGRSLSEMLLGALEKNKREVESTNTKDPSSVPYFQRQLAEAKEAGDTDKAGQVIAQVRQRRRSLLETGIKQEEAPAAQKEERSASVLPSAAEMAEMKESLRRGTEAPTTAVVPIIKASKEQMDDMGAEIRGWAGQPSYPGHFGKNAVAETSEAKEMDESPDGPKDPPANLPSVLMDKLEAHHAHLTNVLRTLPAAIRSHAAHSGYFSPAHELFAQQLETGGAASFEKSDRDSLREKRDLIAGSQPNASKFEIRRRGRMAEQNDAIVRQNVAATSYGDQAPVVPFARPLAPGVAAPAITRRTEDSNNVVQSYMQDTLEVPENARAENQRRALSDIDTRIADADKAARNVPSHIASLTVHLPKALADLKAKMNSIRENGTFVNDDPSVNHKAVMDIADGLSTINNSINSSIKTGTKNAIKETFAGTGLSKIPASFNNFFGTNIHSKVLAHIKWMGKNLTQRKDSESWRNHSEPHPEWVENANIDNLENVLKGLKVKEGLSKDQLMSKRGHIWGMRGKTLGERDIRSGPREQLEVTPENARRLKNSREVDSSGVRARDLGLRMERIIRDYNNGDTAKYTLHEQEPHWQATFGKEGSGTSRIKGSGDPTVQRAAQDLYPYSKEAVEQQEARSKPIVVTDSETGEETRVAAGTGRVYVKGTKKKVPRSQGVLGSEAAVSRTSRAAAVRGVQKSTDLAAIAERLKKQGTTYDKTGATKPFSKEDVEALKADPAVETDVYSHIRTHQQLIEKHASTIRNSSKDDIPQEDRRFLGASGLREAHRRAAL